MVLLVSPSSRPSARSLGAKKGKKVDSCKPKRPLTAYNIFFKEQRQQILVESNGNSGGFAELARTIALRWKNISPIEYKVCCRKAVEDKQRYGQEMLEWSSKIVETSPVASNNRADQDIVSESPGDNSIVNLSTRSGPHMQQLFMERRSSTTDSVLSCSEAACLSTKSFEYLITRRAQLLCRDMMGRAAEQEEVQSLIEHPSALGVRSNDNLAPLPIDRTQNPGNPGCLERVFDEVWLESECNLDLDDATSCLLSRMLE